MTTIVDIAKKLNVSPSTVSRALAASKEVSESTRRKVSRLAREMKYTPNQVARNLRCSSTHTIGCLVFEYANPFYVPMIEGIEDAANSNGYSVMISQSRRELAKEVRLVRHYSMHQVSGLIVMPVLEQTAHIVGLPASGIPVISVGRIIPQIDSISIDNTKGASLIAEHFAGLGYERLGMILSGDPYNEPEGTRLKGFRDTAIQRGLEIREEWILTVQNNRTEGGLLGAQRWSRLQRRPDAVFCSNDRVAVGFIHRLLALGFRIPEDCAVAGFDDLPDAEFLEIPLTTIAYPKYQMGKMAAERLIGKSEGRILRKKPEHQYLEPRIMVRRSSVDRDA